MLLSPASIPGEMRHEKENYEQPFIERKSNNSETSSVLLERLSSKTCALGRLTLCMFNMLTGVNALIAKEEEHPVLSLPLSLRP